MLGGSCDAVTRCVRSYRFSRYSLLALVLAACVSGPPPESPSQALGATFSQLAVRVQAECPGGSWGGSGALVADGVVVTAQHLTADGCAYEVSGNPAKLRGTDENRDLAILEVSAEGVVLPLADNVWLGMDVWHVGYPALHMTREQELSVTRGVLASEIDGWYRVTSSFYSGSSGGPVVNVKMELVGVVSRFFPSRPDEYYVTPYRHVLALMKKEGLTP